MVSAIQHPSTCLSTQLAMDMSTIASEDVAYVYDEAEYLLRRGAGVVYLTAVPQPKSVPPSKNK